MAKKRKDGIIKQWFCNRIGAISTQEFDDFIEDFLKVMTKMDDYIKKQDEFNRLVGSRLHLGQRFSDKELEMYG